MYAGAVAVPLIVGRALKLSPEQVAMLISADLFCCGLVTLIQSLGATQWFGIKLPVMMGVTFAVGGAHGGHGQQPTRAWHRRSRADLWRHHRRGRDLDPHRATGQPHAAVFPPVVTGTIIAVIGISLMRIGINWIFGNPFGPTAPSVVNPEHAKWLADVTALAGNGAVPAAPKGLALVGTVPNPKYAQPGAHCALLLWCWPPFC
jgi:hypothetical protein